MKPVFSSQFERAIAFVINEEGDYVNDPMDPGGATRWGVSIRAHKEDVGDLDHDGDIDAEDVRILPLDQAKAIYHEQYWTAIRGDELPGSLALAMLDTAVNCGTRRAIILLQRAVAADQDGLFGPDTMRRALKYSYLAATNLLANRLDFYKSLSSYARYGKGWRKRVARLNDLVKQLYREEMVAA